MFKGYIPLSLTKKNIRKTNIFRYDVVTSCITLQHGLQQQVGRVEAGL